MGIAYLAAIMANAKAMPIVADAFVLLGCGVFGASIMLVGQMYHLQGRAEDAVLLWAVGSLLAAFVLRASTALWLAVALFTLWMTFEYWDRLSFAKAQINILYLLFWMVCAALAWWLRSRLSAHLLMMGLVGWIFISAFILTERHDTPIYLFGLYALWFVTIALMITSNELGPWLRGAEATAIRYLSLVIVGMTAVWAISISPDLFTRKSLDIFLNVHLWPMAILLAVALVILANAMRRKSAHVYDIAFCADLDCRCDCWAYRQLDLNIPFFGEAFSLALSIWLIRMGARQDIPAVTRLGYVGFAMIMLLIYFRTAGTLLGTTGFYLTAGVLMVLGAIFLPKLFRSKPANQEAA